MTSICFSCLYKCIISFGGLHHNGVNCLYPDSNLMRTILWGAIGANKRDIIPQILCMSFITIFRHVVTIINHLVVRYKTKGTSRHIHKQGKPVDCVDRVKSPIERKKGLSTCTLYNRIGPSCAQWAKWWIT